MSRLSVLFDVVCVVCVARACCVDRCAECVCMSAGVSQCTACTAGPTPIGWGPHVSLEHFIGDHNLPVDTKHTAEVRVCVCVCMPFRCACVSV